MAGTVTTNTKKYYGGLAPEPTPQGGGDGKTKVLVLRDVTVVVDEHPVTKKLLCDPDSVITVEPLIEVVTAEKLAGWLEDNYVIILDDGTQRVQMLKASVTSEGETPVCNSVVFKGLKDSKRASIEYPCQLVTDESTLTNFIEAGTAVVHEFNLVSAYPEDDTQGTLIDKLMVEDTVQDPDDQPLLEIVPSEDGEGHAKVAINEDNLRSHIYGIYNTLDGIIETIEELDVDSVPHAYLKTSLFQSAGDSVTERSSVDVFAYDALEGDCFEFEQTTIIDDVPFGYVWIEPGIYLINSAVTLQWVGDPRGTFVAKVGKVMGENFDFSQEQEIVRQSTRVVTIPSRMKLNMSVTYDAGTPVMGFWIKSMQVVKLAGGMSQTTVAHGLSLEGNGSVEDPLEISEHGLNEAFEYAKDEEYFATKQEVAPLATKAALQAEITRATQRENEIESLFTLPTQEAVDTWLNEHPEATTTVQDHSLTGDKLVLGTLNFVTPEMFGAVGDGVTDDTEAFENALAFSPIVVGSEGRMYAIHGLYVDNKSLVNCKFKPVAGYTGDGITIHGRAFVRNCTLTSFNYNLVFASGTIYADVALCRISDAKVCNVYIDRVSGYVTTCTIRGCHIIGAARYTQDDLSEEYGCGIYVDGFVLGLFIHDCCFEVNKKYGIKYRVSITNHLSGMSVISNYFEGHANGDIFLHMATSAGRLCRTLITGNAFTTVSGAKSGIVIPGDFVSCYSIEDANGPLTANVRIGANFITSFTGNRPHIIAGTLSQTKNVTILAYTRAENPYPTGYKVLFKTSLDSVFTLTYGGSITVNVSDGISEIFIPHGTGVANRDLIDDEYIDIVSVTAV